MDGVRRAYDNIFVERLWRSLKYEEVYLHDYAMVPQARRGIGGWFEFYNHRRPHQALDYRTPAEVYGIKTTSGSGIGIGRARLAPSLRSAYGLPARRQPWKRV